MPTRCRFIVLITVVAAGSETSHYEGKWDKHEMSPLFKVPYLSAAARGAQHLFWFRDEAALMDSNEKMKTNPNVLCLWCQ